MILKKMNFCRLQDLKTLIVLKLGYKGKLFHSLFKVYILMYFKCFRGRSIRLRTNSMLKKRFFSFKNFHSSTVVCTMMLLPSKLSKFNNVEHSFRQIEKSNYFFSSSRMMSSILGLALGSLCKHPLMRARIARFLTLTTCFVRHSGQGCSWMQISHRRTPKLYTSTCTKRNKRYSTSLSFLSLITEVICQVSLIIHGMSTN